MYNKHGVCKQGIICLLSSKMASFSEEARRINNHLSTKYQYALSVVFKTRHKAFWKQKWQWEYVNKQLSKFEKDSLVWEYRRPTATSEKKNANIRGYTSCGEHSSALHSPRKSWSPANHSIIKSFNHLILYDCHKSDTIILQLVAR